MNVYPFTILNNTRTNIYDAPVSILIDRDVTFHDVNVIFNTRNIELNRMKNASIHWSFIIDAFLLVPRV